MRKEENIIIILSGIIAILVIALIFLGFYTYTLNEQLKTQTNASNNQENNQNSLQDDYSGNIDFNETSVEISKEESLAKELIQKINFPTYAVASIYNEKSFTLNTIPNDLILRLGWSKADKELTKNEDEENINTVSENNLQYSIMEIFGTKLNYTDNTFTNINVPVFHAYYENRGAITYDRGVYTASYSKNSSESAFIHQEIEKILKYDSVIKIYVRTAFIDVQYDEITKNYKYIIYKNFEDDNFLRKVTELTSDEFNNSYADTAYGRGSLDSNLKISELTDELDSYVYTFTIDSNSGKYYLSAFNKIN